MRLILRRPEPAADVWRYPGEAGSGPQVLTLAELTAGAAAAGALGVLIGPTDDVRLLAPYLGRLTLVVVQFEKLGDGRGYSQAQVLRQQVGYRGELRASGALKRDHMYLLARCGFDAFELDPSEDGQGAWAQLERFSVAYQASSGTLVHPHLKGAALGS